MIQRSTQHNIHATKKGFVHSPSIPRERGRKLKKMCHTRNVIEYICCSSRNIRLLFGVVKIKSIFLSLSLSPRNGKIRANTICQTTKLSMYIYFWYVRVQFVFNDPKSEKTLENMPIKSPYLE